LPELPNTPDSTLSTCDPVTLKAADPSQREDPNEEPALSEVEGTSAFLFEFGWAVVYRRGTCASYQGTPSGVPHRHVQMTPLGAAGAVAVAPHRRVARFIVPWRHA
jgi:hypothetical protein